MNNEKSKEKSMIIKDKKNKDKINSKISALVGLIKTNEDTSDFKEYISRNKRLDYENIEKKNKKE